jgi:hypothetical protein
MMPHSVKGKNGEDVSCELYPRQCPKSDVRLMAEHGPPQYPIYWSFGCRTCKHITLVWNPAFVAAAKRKEVDREMGRLMDPRFQGMK